MTTIRPANRDDALYLALVGFHAWESATTALGLNAELRDNARTAFNTFVQSAWRSIVVAEENGEIVGWAARENFDEVITDFWVDPSHHRQGIGAALLEAVERQIIDQGFSSAKLESHAQNAQAIAFFQKHGYGVSWLSLKYSPKLDRDVQSIGLRKQLVESEIDSYGPGF